MILSFPCWHECILSVKCTRLIARIKQKMQQYHLYLLLKDQRNKDQAKFRQTCAAKFNWTWWQISVTLELSQVKQDACNQDPLRSFKMPLIWSDHMLSDKCSCTVHSRQRVEHNSTGGSQCSDVYQRIQHRMTGWQILNEGSNCNDSVPQAATYFPSHVMKLDMNVI